MNPVLQNAIERRDEAREGINEARQRISEFEEMLARAERFIADWTEFSGEILPDGVDQPVENELKTQAEKPKQVRPNNPAKELVAEMSCELIVEAGKPLSRDELFDALPSKGIEIDGKNPRVVLQTMLWRMKDRITHIKGFGYWPANRFHAQSGYSPEPNENLKPLPGLSTGFVAPNDSDIPDEFKHE